MDRNTIVKELSELRFEGKPVYSDKGSGALKKIKKLNTEYLDLYYWQFHKKEYNISNPKFSYGTFKNYRSKAIHFVEHCQSLKIDIESFTQNYLDEYFNNTDKSGTLNVRKTVVEQILKNFDISLDYTEIVERIKRLKIEEVNANPLSSKEIERIRNFYEKDKFKLFIFEWLYSLELDKIDFGKFNIDDFDNESNTIIIDGKSKQLSKYISNLINEIKGSNKFKRTGSVIDVNIKNMESELLANGIIESSFRDMDIKETIKRKTYNVCPECGNTYESVASNWVIKTYDNSNTQWIVCKARCGKVDNE